MNETTRHYLENVEPADWPQQLVSCNTDGCPNEGIELQVPDIGQDVVCGGCGAHLVQHSVGRG